MILSALIRGRARLVFESDRCPRFLSPGSVADEVSEHLPTLAAKAKVDRGLALLALRTMPVEWQAPEVYQPFQDESLRRIAERDAEDWPVVALALATGLPVWSQDKDFQIPGIAVFTTGELLDALRVEGTTG